MSRIPELPLEKIWRTRLWYRHRQCYDELYREGAEYEDIKGSCLRADCQGEEADRRGSGQETYHGYGYHQGCGYLCKKGCTAWRSGRGHGQRI